MRPILIAALCLLPSAAGAWDTAPHQIITRAALATLSPQLFGAEAEPLGRIYCMYPDRFLEMERFGFVRKSEGPHDANEIRDYCMRPNGELVHGATLDRAYDLAALEFLYDRTGAALMAGRTPEAAKYAGVLAHYIADSVSPPHVVPPEELRAMAPWYSTCNRAALHHEIEKSMPPVDLQGRAPHRAAAGQALDRLYEVGNANRKRLAAMVKAVCASEDRALDADRLRAGTEAAAILADALYTIAGSITKPPPARATGGPDSLPHPRK